MLSEKLQLLGFHKNEAIVYLMLLETGQCRAGAIIGQTKLHRNLVYTALEELEKRGLITKVEVSGVAEFSANDPRALLEEIEEKKTTTKEVIDALITKKKEGAREIAVYEGIEGVKRARNKTLQYGESRGETLYVMGGSKRSTMPELESYWRSYHHKREKAGINFKILFDRDTPVEMLDWRNRLSLSKAKYFPFDLCSPTQVGVFKDLVDISIPGLSPLTFVIKNEEIAAGFKQYFEFFWNQQVRVETGTKAVETAIYGMLDELNRGEEYFVLGAAVGTTSAGEIGRLYDRFHADRIKKGVTVNMLANADSFSEIVERNKKSGDPNGAVSHIKKFLSAPPTPMQVSMYKDKCFFILYGGSPAVIYFERPEITAVFKNYFGYFWNQDTYVLRGPEAIRDLWLESVDAGELRYIGARGYFIDRFPKLWADVKIKTALNKNYVMKNIVDPGVRGHEITKLPYADTKYLLSSSKNPNVVWLFGKKLAVANWAKDEPVIFVSENPVLVQSYNDYFDELWRQDKTVFTSQESTEAIYDSVFDIISKEDEVIIFAAKPQLVRAAKFNVEWAKNLAKVAKKVKFLYYGLNEENRKRAREMAAQGCEARIISTPQTLPISTVVAGDMILNTVWDEPTVCFKMNNKVLADSYRGNFELLWKQAIRV